jgi:hypothetical protein
MTGIIENPDGIVAIINATTCMMVKKKAKEKN